MSFEKFLIYTALGVVICSLLGLAFGVSRLKPLPKPEGGPLTIAHVCVNDRFIYSAPSGRLYVWNQGWAPVTPGVEAKAVCDS